MFHNPAAALGRYDLSITEKRALLSGSATAIEECYGKALNPLLVSILEKYRWSGSCELKEAFINGNTSVMETTVPVIDSEKTLSFNLP